MKGGGIVLINQTADKLRTMKLPAMTQEFLRQMESPDTFALEFEERIGMMVDAEWLSRENNRVKKLIGDAKLRVSGASFADIDYRPARKLDRAAVARLADFRWVKDTRNIIITGCTGTGKTWLSCAFGAEACRLGHHVLYYRVNRLLHELTVAEGSGTLSKALSKLKKADLLILDDWGLTRLTTTEGRLLLEVFEDRWGASSTIIAAQLPIAKWHGLFENATIADAALDRVVHNLWKYFHKLCYERLQVM